GSPSEAENDRTRRSKSDRMRSPRSATGRVRGKRAVAALPRLLPDVSFITSGELIIAADAARLDSAAEGNGCLAECESSTLETRSPPNPSDRVRADDELHVDMRSGLVLALRLNPLAESLACAASVCDLDGLVVCNGPAVSLSSRALARLCATDEARERVPWLKAAFISETTLAVSCPSSASTSAGRRACRSRPEVSVADAGRDVNGLVSALPLLGFSMITRFSMRVASEGNCGDNMDCLPITGDVSGIVIILSEFAAPRAEGDPRGVVGETTEDADGDDAKNEVERIDSLRG
ncbi:hypothetical protein GGI24_006652, partial [Coemansia furcata]